MREFWKSVNIGRGYKQECSNYDVWLMPHYHIRVGNRRNVSARDGRYCRRLLRENKIETRENRLKNLSSDGRMPMLIQVWRTSRLGIGVGGRAHIVKYRSEPSVRRHATKSSSHRPSDRLWRLVPAATPRRRDGTTRASRRRSRSTAHWSSPETDFITVFMSSPTLRRLPRAAADSALGSAAPVLRGLSRYNDRSTARRDAARPFCSPTDDGRPTHRRSLIHTFGTWLSLSTTCKPIIHGAPTATRQRRWPPSFHPVTIRWACKKMISSAAGRKNHIVIMITAGNSQQEAQPS